jgi:hypothetical protein
MKWKVERSINQMVVMSNKVDKLFKDKLEGHALQPSAQAWEKVEAHLGKKNKIVVWRIAAGVALLGVLTFVALNWNKTESKREFAKKETEVRSKESEVKEKKVESIPSTIENKLAPKKINRKKTVEPVVIPAPVVEEPEVIEQQVAVVEQLDIEQQNVESPIVNVEQPKTKKGITLTYSLPPVKKQEEPVVAQAEPRKTGLERVLEIAREVKNGDSRLAELREAKDDILALDFRKDKKQKH